MADSILYFPQKELENLNLEEMSLEDLVALQEKLMDRMSALAEIEPEDMNSEAFEQWSEEYEKLEDLADDVADLLN
ncbi:MAG TPA: hypothetical protein IAA70_02910 [Candidatus Avoscillospira stercoripullorum]|uniref:Uncharacterized protein n=1 Tax=Candidatus Avoscillospira stercoripullorum TaxID=2840709 RepID=A0A9D1A7D5_9FIRM|nr:hypothetical protein [Candidatus Avoscillospira stercoripullorum]